MGAAALEEVVWMGALQWNQPLEDPREECPRQKGWQKQRAQLAWPARCLLHMRKGTEMEAGTSRHVRAKKLPIGCLLFLNFNYASGTLVTVFL